MLRKLFIHGDPKKPAPESHWKSVAALACALHLYGCVGHQKAKSVEEKTAHHEHKVIEVQESKGLSENGDLAAPSSWSSGEDFEVWYRDVGDNIVLATRA